MPTVWFQNVEMEKSTFRSDQTAQSIAMACSDVATIIPRLIQDLESDKINLHVPALRQLLEVILDNCENKNFASMFKLIPLLNKFSGNIEKNEEYVLSTAILHLIRVRNVTDDKIIHDGDATELKEKDKKILQLEQSNRHLEEQN
ncbi:MAG: hypothetical protein EZS28_004050 [Streblomastix strix]|uniref:Uncharacterized protein n=1 Tax=Streblomastix strix TaxID=222440 RepID=A0A5J4X115_9EUKA|nr:MAG: hypothetical protein EZS28_004050 [Streblomastix strix]